MIRVCHVTKTYAGASQPVVALSDVSLEIAEKEFAAITGPSGCGKSTLLHLLGALDQPTSGEIFMDDLALHSADDSTLTEYRRRRIGIVFQFFNLLPAMTAEENVSLPLLLDGHHPAGSAERAREMLDLVGLGHRAGHFPHELSGGELQRTAIARALVHRPALLLADEPTGNLDTANAAQVMKVLRKISSRR